MKKILGALSALILALSAMPQAQAQSYAPPSAQPAYGDPTQPPPGAMSGAVPQQYCREYRQRITIENKTQEGYGMACLQPDGSWQLMPPNNQPGPQGQNLAYEVRQNQVYLVPPEPFVFFEYGGGRYYYPHEYMHYYPNYHWHH